MKSIYNAFMTTAVVFGTLSVTTLSSCDKVETTPTNNQTATAAKDSDKYKGKWAAKDVAEATSFDYELEIKEGSDNKVTITNMTEANDILNVNATVSGNKLTIPAQTVNGGDYQHVEGSGTLDAGTNKITVTYKLKNDNGNTRDYTGVWTKK